MVEERDDLMRVLGVSRETSGDMHSYVKLLMRWNQKINLVSGAVTEDSLVADHLLDSAQLLKYIETKDSKIVDIGSGAGFPGIVLAILGYENCHLVEIINKKAVFLKTAASELNLSASVLNKDIRDVQMDGVDYIVSRAVTSILELVEMSKHLISQNTKLLLLKSKAQSTELRDLEEKWNFELQEYQNIYKTEGVVFLIKNLSEKNAI